MDSKTKQFVEAVYAALEAADVKIVHQYQERAEEELRLFLNWAWDDSKSWAEVEESMEKNDWFDSPEINEMLGHVTLYHIAHQG